MKRKDPSDKMRRAYAVSGRVFREQLGRDRPEDEHELASVQPAEVVSVGGAYDHIHLVLEATGVPFQPLAPEQLPAADWSRMQVLFVNCPGQLPPTALRKIGTWVREGGYLVTTDWALKHVLEPVFPNIVRHNGATTSDCVVRVEIADGETDPLLDGFLEEDREPLWWLEGSSYPIEILDPERVRVLVRSREIAERWGAAPVVITFDEGEGTVLHLVSHLYLQRSDVRDARDAQSALSYFSGSLGASAQDSSRYAEMAGDLQASELRGAMSKSWMLSKMILDSRKKAKARKQKQRSRDERQGMGESESVSSSGE